MLRSLILVSLVAAAAAAHPAEAASPVYVRDPLTNKLAQHPSRIGFRDVDLTRLRWTNWGRTRATARGRANVLICEPSCADGSRGPPGSRCGCGVEKATAWSTSASRAG